MQILPEALAPLGAYRQFIVYILSPSQKKPGKFDKYPIDHRTGRMPPKGDGGAHDVEIWTDAQTAILAAAHYGPQYGVGFVFTVDDPFWFLDIDNCRLPDGSDWSPLSKQLVAAFPGAAVEVSSSGKGLHVIGSGAVPPHGKTNKALGLEFYTELRFVALTGTNAVGSAAVDFSHLMPSLVHQFFPATAANTGGDDDWTDAPCTEWRGPTDDDELLRRAMRSSSAAAAFGSRASFADLWDCNVPVLAMNYPADGPDSSTPYDASSVDRALAQHLAFWTGKDSERIKRLMLRSALVRSKWDRDDYLPRTIRGAVGAQRDVLTDKEPEPVTHIPTSPTSLTSSSAPVAKAVTGNTYLGVEAQLDIFKGCVYIIDAHRMLVPGGALVKADQFRVMYGGYTFVMDTGNERTTRDAFEAYTQHQAYRCPRADSTCFKPNLPPGELVTDAGRIRANTWWPVEVPRQVGDATPFLEHMAKLLPNELDRLKLLSYMAAVVQYKGTKFQYAPLIQGVEGNGKTLLTRCVAQAVGPRYTHLPPAHEISEKFNSWLFGTVFIGVEDIYVPNQKTEVFEILKPMITSQSLSKRAMHTDQAMHDCVANFIFNSNHKDGLRKTRNDRRVEVYYTAQQNKSDLARDGMTGDYFQKLYAWLDNGGYAIVSELLHTFPIAPEHNPALGHTASVTSSTAEAIREGMGGVEQEILEAVHQGVPGFCDGWVSSTALGRLLDGLNASRRIPINKRRDLMASIGYEYHPALADGRLNVMVMPDGNKPRLFIRSDHPSRILTAPSEVAKAYSAAQGLIVTT